MTVLGCDGSWPGAGGACSSYLFRTATTSVLIDMGSGSLANLQSVMSPSDLDAVILSHEHPDHCAEIHSLDVLLELADSPRKHLPVYASEGVLEQTFPRWSPQSEFEWTVIEDADQLEIGDLSFTFSRTAHPVVTHAVRVDHQDKSLVYTADTDNSWSLGSLGGDIDVALCEAVTTSHKSSAGHMNSIEAANLARDATAKRLILTHIRPNSDRQLILKEASEVFDGEVMLAEAAKTYYV